MTETRFDQHLRFRMLAAAAIDGPLAPGDARLLEGHLAACPTCRTEALELARDQRRLGDLGEVAPSPRVRATVLEAARRSDPPRAWTVLLAAALLLALAAGLAVAGAWWLQQQDRLPITDQWTAISTDALAGGATTSRIRTVLGSPLGFVAGGSAGGRAAIWLSPSGSDWRLLGELPGGDGAEVTILESTSRGLLAAGRGGVGPAIWVSDDGRAWQSAEPADALSDVSINDVARRGDGWMAVGAGVAEEGISGVVLMSDDGRQWRRVEARVLDGRLPPLESISVLPDGRWLVVLAVDPGGTDGPYVSSDGITWLPSREHRAIQALGGFVAGDGTWVGFDRNSVRLRNSVDGMAWSDVELPSTVTGLAVGVVEVAEELVVVGSATAGPLIVRSLDGRAWTFDGMPVGPAATAYDIAAIGGVEVAVGIREGHGAIWVRRR